MANQTTWLLPPVQIGIAKSETCVMPCKRIRVGLRMIRLCPPTNSGHADSLYAYGDVGVAAWCRYQDVLCHFCQVQGPFHPGRRSGRPSLLCAAGCCTCVCPSALAHCLWLCGLCTCEWYMCSECVVGIPVLLGHIAEAVCSGRRFVHLGQGASHCLLVCTLLGATTCWMDGVQCVVCLAWMEFGPICRLDRSGRGGWGDSMSSKPQAARTVQLASFLI